ncbi:hypothetical protein LZ198_24875 [Myxococcus sp. K15C18031901]|uniref:alpha-2-macroglobulin family protein n=1 Tax=Myxococcus dinghuensis TaxID=2906761 RepID=UPI0020A74765|nr:alpha-2-macroglobulin family protein [Myxococcus dinghuensis]MCP3102107.1 hypothetical protein [Myxococcus dinghuensis]
MKRTVVVGVVCFVAGALLPLSLVLFVQSSPASSGGSAGAMARLAQAEREEASDEVSAKAVQPPPAAAPVMVGGGGPGGAKGGGSTVFGSAGLGGDLKSALRNMWGQGEVPKEPAPEAAPSRAWFPETFLFEPLVVTDASGSAAVPVRVPDRLTSWRVLALAHSRSGAQAGAVARFAGTLPTYVDPVLPPFLRAGDTVRLPVQVVNTTDAPVEAPLKVEATGLLLEGGTRTVRVPARGSVVEYVTARARVPGPVVVRAALGDADAVARPLDVWPTGRPVVSQVSGTLADVRELELQGPAEAVPGSERARLQVYPGGLGVLRSELVSAGARTDLEDVSYALSLIGRAPELLASLGEAQAAEELKSALLAPSGTRPARPEGPALVDAEKLRVALSQATQRALRLGRAPDTATAALLAEGALAHPSHPVLARLGERLSLQVANAQRPDGTCTGGDGWSLQRVLVATADCARAVLAVSDLPDGKRRVALFSARALGAVERNRAHVTDGYTAAALLESGVVTGSLRDALRVQVREALQKREGGAVALPVAAGVQGANGRRPSELEATALAVLALEGDPQAPMADLGTTLLAGYDPVTGWGDGYANRVALRAMRVLFKDPLPAQVRVSLRRDGQVVTEGTYDAKALREVLSLEAAVPGSAGRHAWSVSADPAVPGLGFRLSLAAYVPWKQESRDGLELAVKVPAEARVGQPVEVGVRAVAPWKTPLELRYELPAGVQVDAVSLDALVSSGTASSWDSQDGVLTVQVPPRNEVNAFQANFRVIPTLSGAFQTGATTLRGIGQPSMLSYVPPATWAVR